MSVKHVRAYYDQVTESYNQLKTDLADMEKALADKMVTPEQLEQMKEIVAPVKQNFETLSYYMYLLNQPNKEQKDKKLSKKDQKLLEAAGTRTQDTIVAENRKALENLEAFKEDIVDD